MSRTDRNICFCWINMFIH